MLEIQYNRHTSLFRNIEHLQTAKARLAVTRPERRLKILSFGCSIGDEVATLKFLFPNDDVYGCDINEDVLSLAHHSAGDLGDIFLSNEKEIHDRAPFDLIVASASLCLNPTPEDFKEKFPVSLFDDLLSLMNDHLAEEGLLVITNSSYRFVDAPLAAHFNVVRSDIVTSAGFIESFTRDGEPYLAYGPPSFGAPTYRRVSDYIPQNDEYLADSVFEKKKNTADMSQPIMLVLSPVTDSLKILHQYTRSNTDYLMNPSDNSDNLIVVKTTYSLCQNVMDSSMGYLVSVAWRSLVSDGFYERKPFFKHLP